MAGATRPDRQRGFTLVEMVLVIVIMGIVAATVAVFMKHPIDAYFASASRAALTDVADLTVRRMARDLRGALPNSIGPVGGNSLCIEFIPTKTGGRYLADDSSFALQPNTGIASFNILGPMGPVPTGQSIAKDDWIVVYNLGPGSGSDAYVPNNAAKVSTTPLISAPPTQTNVRIGTTTFPLASGSKRFHVVPSNELSVAYVCDPTGAHTLVRRSSTAFGHVCSGGGAGLADAILAKNVTACSFSYTGSDLQRNGLVNMRLQLTLNSETVTLQHEVHVNNTP